MNHIRKTNLRVKPVKPNESVPASSIGFVRGLFWQPAHIELCDPIGIGKCSCCGQESNLRYTGFLKENLPLQLMGYGPIRIPLSGNSQERGG